MTLKNSTAERKCSNCCHGKRCYREYEIYNGLDSGNWLRFFLSSYLGCPMKLGREGTDGDQGISKNSTVYVPDKCFLHML
jgi:hypothetical protein